MVRRWIAIAGLLIALNSVTASRTAAGDAIAKGRDARGPWVATTQLKIACDLQSGTYDCAWADGGKLAHAACAVKLSDGTQWSSADCTRHECGKADIAPFEDELGSGLAITIHHFRDGRPELRQRLCVHADRPYFIAALDAVSNQVISSNQISTLSGAEVDLLRGDAPRVLFVPFDNDGWVRYNDSRNPATDPSSYEVTAIYDNASRNGFVVGSVSHEVWKSGIEARDVTSHRVGQLRAYGGATGKFTHDSQPHGFVSGTTISGPRIFVGSLSDWRDGMEAFGEANAAFHPAAKWTEGVPFGWNSWAAYQFKVTPARMTAISNLIKQHLQLHFHGEKNVYVNWDSGWDQFNESEIRAVTNHIHANGQKAGIYLAPFGYWGDALDSEVEGTRGRYRYRELVLKDAAGNPLPKIDGAHALDPTHPGTLARMEPQLKRIAASGCDFIKLDFLNFAALEGLHADPKVTTGIEAYHAGVDHILAELDAKRIGRPMFVSLSIAPLFPTYGQSRRVSCDVFGELKDSEYLLNSLTYGWWIGGSIYHFNDPDHIVLHDKSKQISDAAARTRVNASAVAGGLMIDSDDLENPKAAKRAGQLLTNEAIDALSRAGRSFRPVEGNSGQDACDVFVRREGPRVGYVAVFNFDAKEARTKSVAFARLDFGAGAKYRVEDLWTGGSSEVNGELTVHLGPGESTIFRVTQQ